MIASLAIVTAFLLQQSPPSAAPSPPSAAAVIVAMHGNPLDNIQVLGRSVAGVP